VACWPERNWKETDVTEGPVLYVVACGGPPAEQLPAFVENLRRQGWVVCVVSTPSGTKFLDMERLAALSGYPVRSEYKRPEEPDVLPPADAFVVAPATFNTINKWAHGSSDTLALGLLNEAIGLGLPIVAVPWPNAALARHPVFDRSIADLREWGVTVLLDPERLPTPETVEQSKASFPWEELCRELKAVRARLW
jgi:phosphopantothenoylcysteine synthetase/decarboxylase